MEPAKELTGTLLLIVDLVYRTRYVCTSQKHATGRNRNPSKRVPTGEGREVTQKLTIATSFVQVVLKQDTRTPLFFCVEV